MTRLERLQKSGIKRLGSAGRGFTYKRADGSRITATELKRIQALKIPPAWTGVWISESKGGMVQAIGQDAAGRTQYLYHSNHICRRELRKFQRLIKFADALPRLRATVTYQLRQPGLGKDRVMACMLRILSTCFLRPGSQVYASENGSYGIATLRPGHVKVKGDLVEFDFPGKSRVRQYHQIKDRQVSRVVRTLLKHSGREVFKYENGNGEFVNVTRPQINNYIREVMGESFSAKDFRTWAGTLTCACALAKVGIESGESKTVIRRKVAAAIKETAVVLGNTPAVCRSSYICPEIISGFEAGRVIKRYFNSVNELIRYRGRKLHGAEKSLLNLMKRQSV